MQHTLQSEIVKKIRIELDKSGLSQKQLGDKINKSRQMVANYLTGRTDLTINILEEICEVLSIDIENLIKTRKYFNNEISQFVNDNNESNYYRNIDVSLKNKLSEEYQRGRADAFKEILTLKNEETYKQTGSE